MENNVTEKKQNFVASAIFCLLLTAGILSLFYWGSRKEVWFCDEVYSYESANGFEQDWPMSYVDQWMSGDDVDSFFAADWDELAFDKITVRLYNDHVPLYFWLFRIVSFFFFQGSGTIWIGLSINLFCYLIFLGLGYMLFLRLTEKPLAAGLVILLTCIVNRLLLEQVTILRMYMMLLLAEAALLLAGFWILRKVAEEKLSPIALLALFCVSVAGFLTHYDFWIFYAAEATMFCLWLLILAFRKNGKRFWRSMEFRYAAAWCACFAASLLATIGLFPYCRWNLNRGKGQMALASLLDFSDGKLGQLAWGYEHLSLSLFGALIPAKAGLLLIFGCILGGAFLLDRDKKYSRLAGLLLAVLTAQTYQLVVCFTMPAGSEERYLWGAYTIMMFCMAYGAVLLLQGCLSLMESRKTRGILRWTMGVCLSACILATQILIIDGGRGIPYLFDEGKDVALLKENRSIPWVVYGAVEADAYSCYDWRIPERICFLSAKFAEEDQAIARELKGKDFVLYAYAAQLPEALDCFERVFGEKPVASHLTQSTNYSVYRIAPK